ncbi:MAG: ABC transporter ATP-binding protein [Prolixibacteraceae bacterium]|nr:ABC transporter ATP-binding protein [Prolixibacteraceae bacterium]MBN2649803.1 ABC transporter ATP-binding protein [Prolixibacteraceae bacterium]
MKGLFNLLQRFLPPYKKLVVYNVVFNLLGAVFGAFSFLALSPILGILFGTQEMVTEPVQFSLEMSSLKHNLFYYMSQVVDDAGPMKALFLIGFFMIFMVFLKVGFTYLASSTMVPLRNGVVRDIRNKIYRKLLALPVGYYSEEKKGDIIARVTGDVTEIENSIMNSLEMLFKNPILIIISLLVMVYMSWSLTLFVFVMLPLAALITGRVGRTLKKPSRKGQEKMGEILSTIDETLSGLNIIKAFTAENKMENRFEAETNDYYRTMNKLMWRRHLAHPVSEFLGTAIIIIVLWYGGSLILKNEGLLAPEDFMTYLVFFYSIINPAKAFSTAVYSVEKGLASVERIDRILLTKNPIKDKPGAISKKLFEREITFDNVTFSYGDENVLKNINLTIPKGKTVALVGKSGSGKTTMVNLLPRFWDLKPQSRILIDGVDIRDIKLSDLRGLMGYVSQEAILFNDSFRNNIAFGIDNVTESDIVNAAKVAHAHEFISKYEHGYDTTIGDRGSKLSGGQRQRLSIARAVLKNPPIMILDEATSALDTESEKLVQDALEALMLNRTSIVIAHRLSTIKNADVIYVFKKGKIVEQGNHEELLAECGEYSKLHKLQVY